ncbi:unnamed protein product, partial [Callosobruchus maculatus]
FSKTFIHFPDYNPYCCFSGRTSSSIKHLRTTQCSIHGLGINCNKTKIESTIIIEQ